ncbi:hypothetical protein C461_00917 [Halorubrum aidingense JCM 13560]|uniref:Uncharacterized protein n=1 Tax=Halorubrum aidingense JCM 13560 TaxID=1230454 RepID=M0PL51_9EURY|nr:hypothetical protein [Halorubrum aidingense]EMA70806.1 hypothetical protein C461_00917 [Halorubrum aidingense JCM 13560]
MQTILFNYLGMAVLDDLHLIELPDDENLRELADGIVSTRYASESLSSQILTGSGKLRVTCYASENPL